MKKFLMPTILFFAAFLFLFITKNVNFYKYLESGIYYKMGTLKNESGFKTAEFKTINDENSTYEFIKYRAYCDNKGLKIMHSKTYSANGTLLEEFITNEHYAHSDYSGLVNGHIYYNFICGKSVNF